ncbi:MAG TPA: hypothetical protein VF790_00055, partial [Dissulfurispiraceae bacterium]
ISVKGKSASSFPVISGSARLKNAAFKTKGADIGDIDAEVRFFPEGRFSARAGASARIMDAGGKPLDLRYARLSLEGALRGRDFTGKGSFDIKGMRYGSYRFAVCSGSTGLAFRGNRLTLGDTDVTADRLHASARRVDISLPGKGSGYSIELKNAAIAYPEKKPAVKGLDAALSIAGDEFSLDVPRAEVFGGGIRLTSKGGMQDSLFPLSVHVRAEGIDLGALSAASGFPAKPYALSGRLRSGSFEGTLDSAVSVRGDALLDAEGVTLLNTGSKRNTLKEVSCSAKIGFGGKDLELKADAKTGNVALRVSGAIRDFMDTQRAVRIQATLPEVKVPEIRNAFWDIFPDGLLYAGLDGSVSSGLSVDYRAGGLEVSGNMLLKDVVLSGENGEFDIGPVNGNIPIFYRSTGNEQEQEQWPSFEPSGFNALVRRYSQEPVGSGFTKVTVGHFNYGFRILDNITLLLKQEGRVLHLGGLNANIFGGKLLGAAFVDFSDGLSYRVGLLVKGLSMTTLGEDITPARGYISGKIDGVANLKGSGASLSRLIGKADFWTYRTKDEKMKISREFLQKIGGPSVKAYLGDRSYDKGVMGLYIQDGFVVFRELEISNRNFFGIQDLMVKVAPFNNRIAIDHLMWTITEAAQRGDAKKE